MSTKRGTARTLHPYALRDVGEPACLALLGIAADLRSGAIPPHEYDQRTLGHCGSAHCILGHLRLRMDHTNSQYVSLRHIRGDEGLNDLFAAQHPSDPALAADAIERYVFGYAERPWGDAA